MEIQPFNNVNRYVVSHGEKYFKVLIYSVNTLKRPLHNPPDVLLRKEKTFPVQNMHHGEAEMHVLNGPIFGLRLKVC
jgi:hypothetical protein